MTAVLSCVASSHRIVLAALVLLTIAVAPAAAQELAVEPLTIVTASGRHAFKVEMAVTPAEQAKGLMFRRELASDRGMLFPYPREQEATFWMKNTYISLDMVFIRADGTVRRIAERTEPLSEATVYSGGPVLAVLELPAGTAERIGLRPGDRVIHRLFPAE